MPLPIEKYISARSSERSPGQCVIDFDVFSGNAGLDAACLAWNREKRSNVNRRGNLKSGFVFALMAMIVTACSSSDNGEKPRSEHSQAIYREDWSTFRCELMQGFALLASRDLQVWIKTAGNSVELDEIYLDEDTFDVVLAALERLSEEAFVIWVVTKDEAPALCLHGSNLAAVEVPFRILVNTLVKQMACGSHAPSYPWRMRLKRVRKFANEPQTRLFLDFQNRLGAGTAETHFQRCTTSGKEGPEN